MENRRVMLVTPSVHLPGEGVYKRAMYMFEEMRKLGYSVTLVTSDFNHYKKESRNVELFRKNYPDYNDIILLHMPPYKKNISIKRYLAEKYWSHEFRKWFSSHAKEFDVVFFSDTTYVLPVNKICNAYGIKKIIDIRDLRPEVFRIVIKNELLFRIIFFPMKLRANRGFACADEIVAVSQEYLNRGLEANKTCKHPTVVYIGSSLDSFYRGVDSYSDMFIKPANEFWITYAGTLGGSYDIDTVLKAIDILHRKGFQDIRFKIMGQGPEEDRLRSVCNSLQLKNVEFLGFLPYEQMAAVLSKSDLTINALKVRASQSIINKVGDYLAAGIPMLNGSSCAELNSMVEDYKVGVNYKPENTQSLVDCIELLYCNSEMRKEYGCNAKKIALQKFDRKTSYKKIYALIDIV